MSGQRPYQACVRCVMDTSHIEVTFDENGVCNFCHAYEVDARRYLLPPDQARRKLEAIVRGMKEEGRGREYDCVLGVSGGVDSSYLAYKVHELGLHTLAMQFDNGWNSELAVKNIETICRRLGIDLYTYVVDWEEFRDLQLCFLRASVANIEAPTDHGITAALYRVAARRRIRYIVNGNNIVTEQISVPVSYGHNYRDLTQIKAIHRRFGGVQLRTFPTLGFFRTLWYEKARRIRSISLLNFMPYNKAEATRILETELGWRAYGGKHHESIFTRFHQAYILLNKFGVDKRRAHLSNLIYSGQMSRRQALAELGSPPCAPELVESDREYVIKKFGLTGEEFERIMSAPPKSYKDYPNQEWLLRLYIHAARARAGARQKMRRWLGAAGE